MQGRPPDREVRQSGSDQRPEARLVIRMPEMRKFVDDDIVDNRQWGHYKPPAEIEIA